MLFYIANGCPNCNGIISDERLAKGLPCENCFSEEIPFSISQISEICENLYSKNNLKGLKIFCEVEKKIKIFKKIFYEILETSPSSLQISWAKRFFLGESFAIVAPTGTGKSTFGLIISLLALKKVLIIVPTKVLVKQVEQRLNYYLTKTKELNNKIILAYSGNSKEKEILEKEKFDIFICTSAFMYRNFELLKTLDFSFIFVDDVDSFLKNSKNVDNLFLLLGFSRKEIELALKRKKEELDYAELLKIKEIHRKKAKQLIISSATLKPKTNRVLLFQNLLGFEITRFISTLRKVTDTYICINLKNKNTKDEIFYQLLEEAEKLIFLLGEGGLIFVEESFGKKYVEIARNYFKNKGIKAISYLEVNEETLISVIKNREVDIAIGLCHISNPLVRGVDFPEFLKYVIFLGVPKHIFLVFNKAKKISFSTSPQFLYNIILSLIPLFEEEEKITALSYINYLKKYLSLKEEQIIQYEGLYKKILSIKGFLEKKLSDSKFIEKLKKSDEVFLEIDKEGNYYIIVGNASSYLQASGRVSRLSIKGLLPGLSIILVDNFKALNSLKKRLRLFLGEDVEIKEIDLETALKLNEEIKKERENLIKKKIDFKNYLVIVESPHKAKTIANFFGKPSIRRIKNVLVYEIPMENNLLSICASLGHIFNLSRKKGIFGVIKTDGYFYPVFDTIKLDKKTNEQFIDEDLEESREIFNKGEIIEVLRTLSFCADRVFIASDPDAEGEKIAYDLYINLRLFQNNIKRLEIHEITERAFRKALENPQEINLARVQAQLARRIADRWIGFSLSQQLWKNFKKFTLSAGRVQTPVLGWVIERAELAKQHIYKIIFNLNDYKFSIEVDNKSLANKILKEIVEHLKIEKIKEFEDELSPPAPYTTDTILEDAFYLFKFSPYYTMELLQELFELGLITYHRTDSSRISEAGRYQVAKSYIIQTLGEDFFSPREWESTGAHEGIRPTRAWDLAEIKLRYTHGLITFKNPKDSFKLYDIIFRRFIASQTRKTKVLKGIFKFKLPSYEWEETLILEIIKSGYEVLWKRLHIFKPSEPFQIKNLQLLKIPKVFLYNQGTLIQEMKKRGLGRPSTYAEIVSTLLNRSYVTVKRGGLVPTRDGKKVYEYLKTHFSEYISEDFTRELENFMECVEKGEKNWEEICIKLLPLLNLLNLASH